MGMIGEAFVRIRPEMSGFSSELKAGVGEAFAGVDASLAETTAATRGVSTGFAGIGVAAEEASVKATAAVEGTAAKATAAGAEMKKAFGGLGALGGVLAGGLVGKFVYDSAKDAASVQKSNEVIREQFGRSGAAVKAFAEDAGVKLGIPVHMSEAVSAKFGILFNNLHIGKGQAAEMTVGLEKLGGSLASIRGIDPSQALQSLNMAMLGNMRSLKQLGLSFSNAQISSEAMRLGLVKTASSTNAGKIANEALAIARARLTDTESKYAMNTTQVATAQKAVQEAQDKVTASTTKAVGALTPAAKAQAIYALATQNLSGYQKDAAAHADDFANVQRRLSAEFDKAREELGAKLLPAMSVLIGYLADDLPKEIGAVTGFFERFKNVFIPLAAAVGAMVAAWIAYTAAMKIALIAQTAFNVVMDANPISLVALAIVGLVAALAVLYERSATVRRIIDETWNVLRDSTEKVWGAIRVYVLEVWDMIKVGVVTELKAIRDVFNVFKDVFTGNWRGAWNNVKKLFSDVWDGISKIAGDTLEIIRVYVEKKALEIGLAIIEPFSHIPRWLGGGWAQDLKSSMTATLDGLKDPANQGGQGIGDSIKSGVQTGLGGLDLVVANAVKESVGAAAGASPGRSSGFTRGQSLGAAQIKALVRQAGGTAAEANYLAAISGREDSSGDPTRLNDNLKTHDYSVGLFQINFRDMQNRWMRGGQAAAAALAKDPLAQAKYALSLLHNSVGPRNWSTNTPAIQALLGGSTGGGGGGGGGGTGLVVGTTTPKPFSAKQVAAAQDSLDQALKGIIHRADQNGVDLTATIRKHLAEVRKEIGGISSADDVRTARDHVHALATAVADQVAALKTHLNLATAFQGVVTQVKKLGDESTPAIAAQMAKVRAELAKAVTPTEVAKVKAQMTTLKNEISKQLDVVKAQVEAKKSLFDAAWQRLASGADGAFDLATQKAIKNMQVTVQGAFASFQFGGSVTQTPAEAQLAKLQADHDAAAAASKAAADQSALDAAKRAGSADQIAAANEALAKSQRDLSAAQTAADIAQQKLTAAQAASAKSTPLQIEQAQAALTSAQNRVTDLQNAVSGAHDALTAASAPTDAATLAQLQAAVDEDAYQDKVAALQKQAQAERDAANQQLQDAQDAYSQQRGLLKTQMDDRVAAIEAGMTNGTIAAAAGMAELTAVLGDPQYGVDLKNSGIVLGGQLYKGLSDALEPTFKMLNDLIGLMTKAGLLKKPTTSDLPGAITAAGGLGAFLGVPTGGPIVVPGFSTDASGNIIRAIDKQTKALSNTEPPNVTVYVDGGSNAVAKAVAR